MKKDERDLLDVLTFELEFLEKGGYDRWAREPWRPQFIFEDSPTCMNYDAKDHPVPCSECVLMQLVPPEFREAKNPCRHIPFNADGETLDSLYRWADKPEIEGALRNWLRATISRLQEERKYFSNQENYSPPTQGPLKGIPLYQRLHPKCANPLCPTSFHWLAGGRFYRFSSAVASPGENIAGGGAAEGVHAVKHFWLCEPCSSVFTLVYEERTGVELKPLRPEFSDARAEKATTNGG